MVCGWGRAMMGRIEEIGVVEEIREIGVEKGRAEYT